MKKNTNKPKRTPSRLTKQSHKSKRIFHPSPVLLKRMDLLSKKVDALTSRDPRAANLSPCTLDTEEEVEAVVIVALQLRFPHQRIHTGTSLDEDLGLDPDARATLLPGMMREGTRKGGCETRLGSNAYGQMNKVQDIIDSIWEDLQRKCNL